MSALRLLFTVCAVAALAQAQAEPRLTWKGQVDGIIALRIHGERVTIEYRQGAPVEHESYHFYDGLPQFNQRVRVEVLEGRGSVNVTEQPGIDNNYTASVTVEDRQDGSAFYSLAVYWPEAAPPSGRMDHVSWSGYVGGEAMVECRAARCDAKVQGGEPVRREKFKFTRPLPEGDVRVTLDESGGRGDSRLLEQPSERNGYTAKVLVRGFPGGGECSFVLSWPRPRSRGK